MSALNFRIWQRQTTSLGPQKYSHIAAIHHICNEGVASRSVPAFCKCHNCIHFDYGEKSECHLRIKCRQSFFSYFFFLATHTDLYTQYSHSQSHLYAICWRNRHKWLAAWPATCCCDYVETLVSILQHTTCTHVKICTTLRMINVAVAICDPLLSVPLYSLSINAHWNWNLCHILNCLIFYSIHYTRYVKTNKFYNELID